MKKIKIGINGFGRIGRQLTKLIINSDTVELSAINDLADSSQYSILPVQHNGNLDILKFRLARKINFGKFSIDSKSMSIFRLPKPCKSG